MLSIEEISRVKNLYEKEHMSLTQIKNLTGHDYKTIHKYLDMTDFSPPGSRKQPGEKNARPTILEPYKGIIEEMLVDDLENGTRKQRHTATRVYTRLRDEYGYTGGKRTVTAYVPARRAELGAPVKRAFVPLQHDPGESQGDFGECENFLENGIKVEGTHFSLSFPYSNATFIQVKYGMNMECLLESMKSIFEWIGGVPKEIWLDNASTIVASMGRTIDDRKPTEKFARFMLHYGFEAHYANGKSGWEKGTVERSVGYTRQNLLVPVPRFLDIDTYNQELLHRCDELLKRKHYKKDEEISILFEKDKKALLPLPSTPFDTASYETVRTDKYGKFTLEEGRCCYSASPEVASSHVKLKITSGSVTVMKDNGDVIVVHKRLYAGKNEHKESMEWMPYLDLIARRPRAWINSEFSKMVPKELEDYLEKVRNSERGKVIQFISKVTKERSFEEAVGIVTEAVNCGNASPDGLEEVYQQRYTDKPDSSEQQGWGKVEEDLSQYDILLKMEDEK